MKKQIKGIIFLWAIFNIVFYYHVSVWAEQKGLFWEVSSNKSTVYILGSVHLFKKEIYPLDQKIEQAFNSSEVIVFEVNLNEIDSMDMLALFQQKGLYPEGDSLKSHISETTLNLLMPRLQSYGVPVELAMRFRPWLLAMTLQSMELQRLGFMTEYGIDRYFFEKAEGKEITGLESAQYQIEIFDSLSEKVQELFLLYTIRDMDQLSSITDQILKAWESGDISIVEKLIFRPLKEDPGFLPLYEILFYERNSAMALKIENFLKTGKRYFVITGAGHLVGDKGIIEILKKKGYKVRQI
ncbi:MAG: TraB/GumN family protein [Thermodesulfovibrionales bacterium]